MTQRHEPIFNVPPVVVATVAVLLLVHALRMWVFSEAQDTQFLLIFAFIPARYDASLVGSFPGGFGAELWTFFTYTFIHANLLHIGLNLAWLLPFGTALARRFGAVRYTAFMLVTSAAGALAYLVSNPEQMEPMIGASAAISGAMAAAMRFVFQQGGLLGLSGEADAHRVPARLLFGDADRCPLPDVPCGLARTQHAVRPLAPCRSAARTDRLSPGRRISAAFLPA